MAQVDFPASAAQIVDLVGGTDNISKVTHCVTRVRFTLKDFDIARNNEEAIKAVPGVIQVVDAGGQYQVVIGTAVEKMYDEVINITGNAGGEVDAGEETEEGPTNPAQALIKMVSGVMVPILGSLTGCGILASFATLLSVMGVFPEGSDTYYLLYGIGQACLFFFPVLVGASTARYFKMDSFLGGVIGGAMMYFGVATFGFGEGAFSLAGTSARVFGFIPITYQSYTNTVFPAMATVTFASVVNRWLKKYVPDMLSFFLVPTLTLLITLPIALAVIGPVMNIVSGAISSVLLGIYGFSPVLAGIVINALWIPFIVPLGMHQALAAVLYTDLFVTGSSPMLGLLCGIMSTTGVLLGVWAKSKNAETKQLAASTALTNTFGISEPGLYGIVLQHKETIAALCIGSAVTGIIPALFGTAVYSMGASGIFGLPMYLNPSGDMTSFIGAVVTDVAACVVCFLLTYFWPGFDPDKK